MPSQYKNLPAHVDLALKRKYKGGRFYVSQRVPFVVVSENPLKIVHISDFDGSFDSGYYWKKQIFPPIQRLLECVMPLEYWSRFLSGDKYLQTRLKL